MQYTLSINVDPIRFSLENTLLAGPTLGQKLQTLKGVPEGCKAAAGIMTVWMRVGE